MIAAVILFFIAYLLAVWFVYQVMDDLVSEMLDEHWHTVYRVWFNVSNPHVGLFVRHSGGRWVWVDAI